VFNFDQKKSALTHFMVKASLTD